MIWIVADASNILVPSGGDSIMTRAKSRATTARDDERVDLRIVIHLLEATGVKDGPEHLALSSRIKELDRLI